MRKLDRRTFLKAMGAGAAGAGLLGGPFVEGTAEAATPRVVVVRGTDPLAMLKAALKVFPELESAVKGKKVALKPNMSFRNPAAWGNNTSPEVAAAVAELCRQWGAAQITAVDHILSSPQSITACGVGPALAKVGHVQVLSAHLRSDYVERAVPKGKQLKSTYVPRVVANADLLINIPNAKQHNESRVSFGLKNLMGLVWDRKYFHELINLHQGIADLSTLLTPRLTVIDATRVMVNNGPQGPGTVEKLQAIVVGLDPVATDAVALGLTKWRGQTLEPKDVEHLRLAAAAGVGVADLSRIKVIKKRV